VRSSLAFHLNEASQSKFLLSTLSATRPPPLERQDLPQTGPSIAAEARARSHQPFPMWSAVEASCHCLPQRWEHLATLKLDRPYWIGGEADGEHDTAQLRRLRRRGLRGLEPEDQV